MMERGDELLAHIAAGDHEAAEDLLEQFHSGYPIERLRPLLQSDRETAVKAGAWIASELGERAAPLVPDLSRLLAHSSRYVRFFAIDSILVAAGGADGRALAGVVELIQDTDSAVRWKALNFLSGATHDQLTASIPFIRDRRLSRFTEWLLQFDRSQNAEEAVVSVDEDDQLKRMFACAAAARMSDRDVKPLERALGSSDPEVSSFAQEQLDNWRNRRARDRRRDSW